MDDGAGVCDPDEALGLALGSTAGRPALDPEDAGALLAVVAGRKRTPLKVKTDRVRPSWVYLSWRIFEVDALRCACRGGRMALRAMIEACPTPGEVLAILRSSAYGPRGPPGADA